MALYIIVALLFLALLFAEIIFHLRYRRIKLLDPSPIDKKKKRLSRVSIVLRFMQYMVISHSMSDYFYKPDQDFISNVFSINSFLLIFNILAITSIFEYILVNLAKMIARKMRASGKYQTYIVEE